jgi:hypothetical protein
MAMWKVEQSTTNSTVNLCVMGASERAREREREIFVEITAGRRGFYALHSTRKPLSLKETTWMPLELSVDVNNLFE